MKTNKLLAGAIALFGIAILISSFKKPEDVTKEYLTIVLSRQGLNSSGSTVLAVIPDVGPPDITELEGGSKKDILISNAVSLNSALNQYAKKGFKLVSSVCDNVGIHGTSYYYLEKN